MLAHDPFPYFEYLTQTQLGEVFGVSAYQLGAWLSQLRLKGPREPTPTALSDGLAKPVTNGDVTFYAWSKERVVALLLAAGHKPKSSEQPGAPPQPALPLVGPFTPRQGQDGDYEIVGSDGGVAVWTKGEINARRLATLMTLAHRFGKL